MNKSTSNYELLIIKEFEGELSLQEKQELEDWMQFPDNKIIYEEQKKLLRSVAVLQK